MIHRICLLLLVATIIGGCGPQTGPVSKVPEAQQKHTDLKPVESLPESELPRVETDRLPE